MSSCASSRSAGGLHSVVEYPETVHSYTKRFASCSPVRSWQAMPCAAPTVSAPNSRYSFCSHLTLYGTPVAPEASRLPRGLVRPTWVLRTGPGTLLGRLVVPCHILVTSK